MGLREGGLRHAVAFLALGLVLAGAPRADDDSCPDPLFACSTDRQDKGILVCARELVAGKAWDGIQYRFGRTDSPPELAYPHSPAEGKPPLFFSHFKKGGEYWVNVRFVSGKYTYRVYSVATRNGGDAGVTVTDARGRTLATIHCNERPTIFPSYLRLALPCDESGPYGAAACQDKPPAVGR